MKVKENQSVSIIGGADGPTSIFIAGRNGKRPLKQRIRNYFYKCRRRRMEGKIVPGEHTLKEVIIYADKKYGVIEIDFKQDRYVEQRKGLKESLILKHKPELLGEKSEIIRPEVYDEESVKRMFQQIQERSERISRIPDSEMPMDFHIYEMKIGQGLLVMEVDYLWEIFGLSYSGSKKEMKKFKKAAQDLYLYYGVTKEDIETKSERYSSLVTTLSS